MKAVVLKSPGGIDQLVMEEIPVPVPKPNEVLVRVHAISINPVDIKTRKGGAIYNSMKENPPPILGWDVSGVITATGSEVKNFEEGDEVFGMVYFPGHGKAYAEFVAADETHLALKPKNIPHAEAAAATLAALTAWQVLVQEAKLQKGQHLLMHAAAGGVGHFAVQIAKHLGARVSGTASAANAEFLKNLGMDQHIDYTTQKFEDAVKDINVVFDPIGGETTIRSIEVLKPGGILISIVGGVKEPLQEAIAAKNIQAKNYLVHSSGTDMEALAKLLEEGILKPHIEHRFPFNKIAEAHEQIETGKTRGKVIINIIQE